LSSETLKDTLLWGTLLWLLGYLVSVALFAIVPVSMIGWIILPIGVVATLLILFFRVRSRSLSHYVVIAVAWTLIAIVLDFLLIVKLFKPEDGYYKFDVYLYYLLTFTLPLVVGLIKRHRAAINE
jgi:hypothetical protein